MNNEYHIILNIPDKFCETLYDFIIPPSSLEYDMKIITSSQVLVKAFKEFVNTRHKTLDVSKIRNTIKNIDTLIDEYKLTHSSLYYSHFRIMRNIDVAERLCKNIQNSVLKFQNQHRMKTRIINHVFGNFEEILAPSLIQCLFSHLKKKNENLKYIMKSNNQNSMNILSQLKENNIKVDSKVLIDFFRSTNGKNLKKFCKDFEVNLYKNGKKQSNKEILTDAILQIIKIEKDYTKSAFIYSHIRGLPTTIENKIVSYIYEI
tara:strand:+ start:335 stop:1117 length:783 start_codon:yes stop_codon:yes gene_type:complete